MANPHVSQVVSCANCKAKKGEVNHWYIVKIDERNNIHLRPLAEVKLTKRDSPVCGRACANILLGRWFDMLQEHQ